MQFFRAALMGETDGRVSDTIHVIAAERLYWLWPELDSLAVAEDREIALSAREALEQMREDIAGGLLVH